MKKIKKNKQAILTDIIVAMKVVCVVGGMILYAHYDIKGIVNG